MVGGEFSGVEADGGVVPDPGFEATRWSFGFGRPRLKT